METNSEAEFNTLGIKEVLDQDSRPTFIVDLDPDEAFIPEDTINTLSPVYCNLALRLHEKLFDNLLGNAAEGLVNSPRATATYEEFKTWATGVTKFDDSKDVFPLSFLYGDMLWTGSTVRKRWRFISGNLCWQPDVPLRDLSGGPPPEISMGGLTVSESFGGTLTSQQKPSFTVTEDSRITAASTRLSSKDQPATMPSSYTRTGSSSNGTGSLGSQTSLNLCSPLKAVSDWTAEVPTGVLSAHMEFARKTDWGSTPLGPMASWSREFRQACNLVMSNSHPCALWWGSDLTLLYNEAYAVEVAGNKHPSLMGTGGQGPFSETWEALAPLFAECARTGISIRKADDYFPLERFGFLEETFFSWSFTPLYGGTNRILGFYNAPFETTQQVLSHRRMLTINTLGERLAQAKSVRQFWKCLLKGLEHNPFDIPIALLYSVGDNDDIDQISISSGSTISMKSCNLEGAIGIPEGHVSAPPQLDLKRSREGFVPSFREAMRTREPTSLHVRDGTLPESLLEGITWRGFGDPCQEAIIFPVRPTNGEMVLAFLLVGVNPRRPYDSAYRAFTSLLNRQLATSLASVILFEDEIRRSRNAAEAAVLEQEQLTQQLAVQTSRLRRMTEVSPLGMFLISPDGVLQEANDRYFEMTGFSREDQDEMSWMSTLKESSKKTMEEGWHRLVVDHLSWSAELELSNPSGQQASLQDEPIDYWVLSTVQPEFAHDGSLRSLTGSIVDISHMKWAQNLQTRRLQEAEETRRQQNEFIDITSHEMRNPLSAILQCADDITSTLDECRSKGILPSSAVIENCVDAANTITLCVQHQKSIVDDILTISKLDSNLLVITPVVAQPLAVVKRAIKMFDSELQAKDIKVVTDLHPSFQELNVDWMTFDPSRILQILINLLTNAIKFTATAATRMVTVTIGASVDRPMITNTPKFGWIPTKMTSENIGAGKDWGQGQLLYLRFKVQDTGCGLTEEEKQVLFNRFSQASHRTHAQYGGSGLGLFISRQLAELHGGMIGVASEAGVGSNFGFFIAARRAISPERPQYNLPGSSNNTLQQRVAPQRQDVASESPAAGLIAIKASPSPDPQALDILVVEDNLVNQKVLVKQLKKVGCSVAVANDGLEALAYLEKTHYRLPGGEKLSVILMDLEMPNMDGLTCVREIRNMQAEDKIHSHIPVIAVTANVRDEQIATAKQCGMDDVVSKPFRIPDLFAKINQLLAASSRDALKQSVDDA